MVWSHENPWALRNTEVVDITSSYVVWYDDLSYCC